MGQMATIPVFACRVCGKPVYGVHLSTQNDPDNERLKLLMQGLAKAALCDYHKNRYNYLAERNRSDEMPLNPNLIIYSVIDNTKANYYGEGLKKPES